MFNLQVVFRLYFYHASLAFVDVGARSVNKHVTRFMNHLTRQLWAASTTFFKEIIILQSLMSVKITVC